MAELTEEAKTALQAEIRDFLYENQKILDEVTLYRWVIRIGFVLFLGGSIFGIFQIQKYVDDKITEQVGKLDHLTLASNIANSGQGRSALYELDVFIDEYYKFKSGEPRNLSNDEKDGFRVTNFLTDSQREFFFRTLLAALNGIDDIGPDGEFYGAAYWNRLLHDSYFKRSLSTGKWENDAQILNTIAQQHMRYSPKIDAMIQGRNFHQRALLASKQLVEKAQNNFGLATLDFIEDKINEAADHFVAANSFVRRHASYDNNFEDSVDYKIIKRLSINFDQVKFQSQYDQVFNLVAKKEAEKSARDAVARATAADDKFDENKILTLGNAAFTKLILVLNGGAISTLSNIATPEFIQKIQNMKHRMNEVQQIQHVKLNKIKSIVITDVYMSETILTARLLIVSETVNYTTNLAGVLLRGESSEPDERQDFFGFVRRRGDHADAWRLQSVRGLD